MQLSRMEAADLKLRHEHFHFLGTMKCGDGSEICDADQARFAAVLPFPARPWTRRNSEGFFPATWRIRLQKVKYVVGNLLLSHAFPDIFLLYKLTYSRALTMSICSRCVDAVHAIWGTERILVKIAFMIFITADKPSLLTAERDKSSATTLTCTFERACTLLSAARMSLLRRGAFSLSKSESEDEY